MNPIVPLGSSHDKDKTSVFDKYQNDDPFNASNVQSGVRTEDIEGGQTANLDYKSEPIVLESVDIYCSQDIVGELVNKYRGQNDRENKAYFYHGDHLGSANWITDADARIIHNYQYTPFGELIIDNSWDSNYDERYKFTGKERDGETGYDYFGARYFWSAVIFLKKTCIFFRKHENVHNLFGCFKNYLYLCTRFCVQRHSRGISSSG